MSDISKPYRDFRRVVAKGRAQRKNFENAANGAVAIYELHINPRDTLAFIKLYKSIIFFINKNPIGKLISRIHEVHFQTLFQVMDAVNLEFSEVQVNFDKLTKEIDLFVQDSDHIINDTILNKRVFSEGPFYLGAKIISENKDLPQDRIRTLYTDLQRKGTNTIRDLDSLLTYYIKTQKAYQIIYKSATQNLAANSLKNANFKSTLAQMLQDRNFEDFHLYTGKRLNENIGKLLENRNDWARWVGIDNKPKASFVESKW
ncbi:hypothetical protein [Dyadobacter aurulentus]|uniref:hypothetical protein n=1 Tax=Dyadobacter sp. UC 10 TaxID=2605428 RepID=UPI0011F123F7|nr:hypothetical protein [Dyadobacter sp. UC 10]KAA0989260.1 hypothetical protein FXO21_03335 [Dyadobacter sp. UC 10]